jgi:hypothetical protein
LVSRNVNFANRSAAQNGRTVGDPADGSSGGDYWTVRANSLKTNAATDADDADANFASHSVLERTCLTARLMSAAEPQETARPFGLDLIWNGCSSAQTAVVALSRCFFGYSPGCEFGFSGHVVVSWNDFHWYTPFTP